jgi:hypothetical protein
MQSVASVWNAGYFVFELVVDQCKIKELSVVEAPESLFVACPTKE